ncbi:MAG: hypothetical protein ABI585_15955, partial [Betaproteobacteria bacterium]
MPTKNTDSDSGPPETNKDGNEELRGSPEGRRRFVRDTLVAGGLLAASVALPDIGMRSALAQQSTTTTPDPTTTTFPPTTTTTFPPTTTF